MTPSKIYAALGLAQSQIRGAVKDSTNPHFRSRYADLESVIDAIRQPLADNDLAFLQTVQGDELHTVIIHQDGGQLVSVVPFVGQMPDMQKVGAALTYARRQGLCTAFGVPQVDDDGNESANPAPAQAKAPAKAPAKKAPPAPVVDTRPPPAWSGPAMTLAADEAIPAGLATDGAVKEKTPITDKMKLDLEKHGLNVEVKNIYPLYVEGRDNEMVKQILRDEKIPLSKLHTLGAKLKEYCANDTKSATLHESVVAFFMENK